MSDQNQEIYIITLIGIVLALLLIGSIVFVVFLYQRRRFIQEKELAEIKVLYEQELLRSQLEMQESTFKFVAQELHDNIGQVLSVIKLSLSILPLDKNHPAYEGIQNCRDMLNKVIFDVSHITKSMHSDRISDIGIDEAIRFELDTLRKTGLTKVDFEVAGTPNSIDPQKAIFIFRMFQEMINNILKHAQASQINVGVNYTTDNKFVLKVADNGIGFNAEKKQTQTNSSSGIGLRNMVNRAKLIGALISIQSEAGNGTAITVELPEEK
ncbi:MAG TPA: ATP-binding protein [Puia sp.]|jgi:two-component system NarL family sensor kinase